MQNRVTDGTCYSSNKTIVKLKKGKKPEVNLYLIFLAMEGGVEWVLTCLLYTSRCV